MSKFVSLFRRSTRLHLALGAIFLLSFQALISAHAERHALRGTPETLSGPARVVDGDTIDIGSERIRLEGIDAPETAQTCSRVDGRAWSCGRAATKELARLIGRRDVTCEGKGRDKYGRLLAICYAAGNDINAAMVRSGYARAFVKYSSIYIAEEREARQRLAGIWQGKAEAPWDFRHKGWTVAGQTAPNGCAIKGNISRHGHIYHMPWSPWYDRVTVDSTRGERWFCSETDALAAGWRPSAAE